MRKINWSGCISATQKTFAFAIIGCLAGCWVVGEIDYGKWQWWQSLGQPGAGAIRFLKMDPNWNNLTVVTYVEDTNGNTFRCCTLANDQWEQVNLRVDKGTTSCDDFPYPVSKPPTFSNLPSKVVDCVSMQWGWEWVTNKDFIAILENGSVWKWHYYSGVDQSLRSTCGTPLVAIAIGWLAIVLIRKRQTSKNNVQ